MYIGGIPRMTPNASDIGLDQPARAMPLGIHELSRFPAHSARHGSADGECVSRSSSLPKKTGPHARIRPGIHLALFACAIASLAPALAQTNFESPTPPLTLTNIKQIWDVSGAAAHEPQRIKTEALIYYFDRDWNCVFGESQGRLTFLPIATAPLPLKPGERIALDGFVIPAQTQFLWNKTRISVLDERVSLPFPDVTDLAALPRSADGQLVSIQGIVGSVRKPDITHLQMDVLSGSVPVLVTVLTGITDSSPLYRVGDFLRLKGVFSGKWDQDGNHTSCSVWVAGTNNVEVTGSLRTDPRFAVPETPVEKIFDGLPGNQMVRITGRVRSHDLGRSVIVSSRTGQVTVQSAQVQPLHPGESIEAIGFPYVVGVQACLRNALYRLAQGDDMTTSHPDEAPVTGPIFLAAQLQHLTPEQAKLGQPVKLRAVLTFSAQDPAFAYVEDASGGVRLDNPRLEQGIVPGSIVEVTGNVAPGDYVPIVTNALVRRIGWRGFEAAQPISLEEALLGAYDGQWVEMHGYVRETVKDRGLTRLKLTTGHGEFEASVPASPLSDSLAGAIVSLDGVLSATANEKRQLTGIRLLVPDAIFIRMDEPKSADVFATADSRPLGNLRRFDPRNDLNQRMKTTGTVVLYQPGRYLYLQDGADSAFALSRQHDNLQLGDRVEVVGFPGSERGQFLLREAVFRRLSSGTQPPAFSLPSTNAVNEDWAGLLATAKGVLLNLVQRGDHVRLLVRNGGSTFEAGLELADKPNATRLPDLPIGCRILLTGVYEVQHDEYGRAESFSLLLRSWTDVSVLARPPWWTLPRLLLLLATLMVAIVISVAWVFLLSRKNALLKQTEAELKAANQELESFSYSVSHDLRAPLRSIDGFCRVLMEDCADRLDSESQDSLHRVRNAAQRMGHLIDALLQLSHHARAELRRETLDLSSLAASVAADLEKSDPNRKVSVVIEPGLKAECDPNLMRVLLENLIGNAWKFTSRTPDAKIEFGQTNAPGGRAFFVRDNGAGFDMTYAQKMFGAFQRFHSASEFPGTGIGLATVLRIVNRHRGHVWAEGQVGHGATFYFTLVDNVRSRKQPG